MARSWFSLSALALITGCTVGPQFTRPTADVPAQWRDVTKADHPIISGTVYAVPSVALASSDPDPRWWKQFGDAELDSLVERALAGNLDLQSAIARIASAREQVIASRAAGLPSLSANASYERDQEGLEGILKSKGVYNEIGELGSNAQTARSALSSVTSSDSIYQDGFDASWELDLFGRVRRSVESSQAQADSQVESKNDALVSLEAEVARTYSRLRGTQALKKVVTNEVDQENQILALTRSQAAVGLTSQDDVQSATAQLSSLQSQLPQFDAQIAQAMNALAVLIGKPPGALDAELSIPTAIPPVPPTVPVGVPSTLARRRPDIRRAEAQLHAATAEVGVSIAQLYPDISLTGSVGTRAVQAKYLAEWSSLFWSIGPSISLPIFEGGELRANVRIAKAQAVDAALNYRSTVLKALQDVEDDLVVYRTDQEMQAALARTVDADHTRLNLAEDSYRKGLVSFITVLDAERTEASERQQLLNATTSVTTDLVALYKALGGGWQR